MIMMFGQELFLSSRVTLVYVARLLFVIVRSVLSGFRIAGLLLGSPCWRMVRNGYPYLLCFVVTAEARTERASWSFNFRSTSSLEITGVGHGSDQVS